MTASQDLRWRLIIDRPRSGARNMALDHALALHLEGGWAVLRLYAWEAPTVSFGRNEPAVLGYARERPEAEGLGFVRRPTGGRAVLHDREVTYAVVAPLRAFGGPREAYRAINDGLVAGLAHLGVEAGVSAEGVVSGLDAGPCFHVPAPGEVIAGGRKLVGSAQARVGGALLQHGSVILHDDQATLAAIATGGQGWAQPAALASLLGKDVEPADVATAVADGCRLAWGGSWMEAQYAPLEVETADRLVAERYARSEWTWRR